jgi:acyl phosphate:glycerol-3-phosphate acyltransferase
VRAEWVAVLAGSYLLGSLSFSLAIVWLLKRADLRRIGSGNAGATNVLRAAGRWPALVVLALDIAKGIVPVRIARALGAPAEIAAAAGLAVVLGHVFPLFFGFRGGKGVAAGFGALFSLFPMAGAASLMIFLAFVFATRYVSLGSIVSAAALPPMAWAFGRAGWTSPPSRAVLAIAFATAGVVLLRHAGNLGRLVAGTERKLGQARRDEASAAEANR